MATMDVVPALTALTTPLEFTVATLVVALVQVTLVPDSTFPAASRTVATACVF